MKNTLIAVAIIIIVGVASLLVLSNYMTGRNNIPPVTNSTIEPPSDVERVIIGPDNDPFLGPAEPAITIIEFSDYQCLFCVRFYKETLPLIKKNYIDAGKVKFVYRDFPLVDNQYSWKAAEASECVHEQDITNNDSNYTLYWKYHDILFQNHDSLDTSSLKQYAKDIGLNSTEFNECLDSGKMYSEVENDAIDGTVSYVSGTPYFFINGIPVDGAYPYEVFQSIIEKELARQKQN